MTMLTADDFYDVLAARERTLEEEWLAARGLDVSSDEGADGPSAAQLQEKYLQKAANLGLVPSRLLHEHSRRTPSPNRAAGARPDPRVRTPHTAPPLGYGAQGRYDTYGSADNARGWGDQRGSRERQGTGREGGRWGGARPAAGGYSVGAKGSSAAAALVATERALFGGGRRRRKVHFGLDVGEGGPGGDGGSSSSGSASSSSSDSESSSSAWPRDSGRHSGGRSRGHSRERVPHGYGSDRGGYGSGYGSPVKEGREVQYERQLLRIVRPRGSGGRSRRGQPDEPSVAFLRTWRGIKNREALHRQVVKFLMTTPEELKEREQAAGADTTAPAASQPSFSPPLPPAPAPLPLPPPPQPQYQQQPTPYDGQHVSYSYDRHGAINQGTQFPSPRNTGGGWTAHGSVAYGGSSSGSGGGGYGSSGGGASSAGAGGFAFHTPNTSPVQSGGGGGPAYSSPPAALQSSGSFRRPEGLQAIQIPEVKTPASVGGTSHAPSRQPAADPRVSAGGASTASLQWPSPRGSYGGSQGGAAGVGPPAGGGRPAGHVSLDGWVGEQAGRPDASFQQMRAQQDAIAHDVQSVLQRLAQVRSKLGGG